jgi:hypothetical protein
MLPLREPQVLRTPIHAPGSASFVLEDPRVKGIRRIGLVKTHHPYALSICQNLTPVNPY